MPRLAEPPPSPRPSWPAPAWPPPSSGRTARPAGRRLLIEAERDDIDVFTISPLGAPSARPVVTADPGNVPFAVSFDARGHLVVAEAGPNAVATFTITRGGTVTLVDRAATGPDGNVVVSVYSSGAIGRLVPEDVTGLVRYLGEHESLSA